MKVRRKYDTNHCVLKREYISVKRGALSATNRSEQEEFFQKGLEYFQEGFYNKSLRIFKTLANNGHAKSLYALGRMYDDGLGIYTNAKKAQEWYKKACMKGSVEAQLAIAYSYMHGFGTPKNIEEAVNISLKAAESGDATALFNVGYIYWEGIGQKKDIERAIHYFQKASFQLYPSALKLLTFIWYKKKRTADILSAFHKYKQLAQIDLLCHYIQVNDKGAIENLLERIRGKVGSKINRIIEELHGGLDDDQLKLIEYYNSLTDTKIDYKYRFNIIKAHVYLHLCRSHYFVNFFTPSSRLLGAIDLWPYESELWPEMHYIEDNGCIELFKLWIKSFDEQVPQFYSLKTLSTEPWRNSYYRFEYNRKHRGPNAWSIVSMIVLLTLLVFSMGYFGEFSSLLPGWVTELVILIVELPAFVMFILVLQLAYTLPNHIDNINRLSATLYDKSHRVKLKESFRYVMKNIWKDPIKQEWNNEYRGKVIP